MRGAMVDAPPEVEGVIDQGITPYAGSSPVACAEERVRLSFSPFVFIGF